MLEDWQHYKKITITGSSGAGTNYQKDLKVGESSGASGYDFHLEGNSANFPSGKNDGGDLRFTSSDGETLLPFWVEKVEGTAPNRVATIWVRVADNLDNNQDIFCYYGNSSASNASNGDNTFDFFDDFEGTSLDTTKWSEIGTGNGSVSISNDLCHIILSWGFYSEYKYYGIIGRMSFQSQGHSLRFRSRAEEYKEGQDWGGWSNRSDGTQNSIMIICNNNDSGAKLYYYKETQESRRDLPKSLDTNFHTIEIQRTSDFDIKILIDSSYKFLGSNYLPTVAMYPHFTNFASNFYDVNDKVTEIDYIFVRKYIDPEPAFSSAGEEQNTGFSSIKIEKTLNYDVLLSSKTNRPLKYRIPSTSDKRGFVYGTTSKNNPGNVAPENSGYDSYIEKEGNFALGPFEDSLSGLTKGQIYYVRAYAHSNYGYYVYGNEVSFITKTDVKLQKSLRYDIQPPQSYLIEKILKYSVTKISSITKDLTYKVPQAIKAQKSLRYTIKTISSVPTKSLKYDIFLGSSKIEKSIKYKIVKEIKVQKELASHLLIKTQKTKYLAYKLRSNLKITKDLRYSILTVPQPVEKNLIYKNKRSAKISKELNYQALPLMRISKGLRYCISLTPVPRTKILSYSIFLGSIVIQKELSYKISASIRNQENLVYRIILPINSQLSLKYTVLSISPKRSKSLRYAVLLRKKQVQKALSYQIHTSLITTKTLKYQIRTCPLAITKSLKYNVTSRRVSQRILRYSLEVERINSIAIISILEKEQKQTLAEITNLENTSFSTLGSFIKLEKGSLSLLASLTILETEAQETFALKVTLERYLLETFALTIILESVKVDTLAISVKLNIEAQETISTFSELEKSIFKTLALSTTLETPRTLGNFSGGYPLRTSMRRNTSSISMRRASLKIGI